LTISALHCNLHAINLQVHVCLGYELIHASVDCLLGVILLISNHCIDTAHLDLAIGTLIIGRALLVRGACFLIQVFDRVHEILVELKDKFLRDTGFLITILIFPFARNGSHFLIIIFCFNLGCYYSLEIIQECFYFKTHVV